MLSFKRWFRELASLAGHGGRPRAVRSRRRPGKHNVAPSEAFFYTHRALSMKGHFLDQGVMRFLPLIRRPKAPGGVERLVLAPRGRLFPPRPFLSLAWFLQYFSSSPATCCRRFLQIPFFLVTFGKGQPPMNCGGALADLRAVKLAAGRAETY